MRTIKKSLIIILVAGLGYLTTSCSSFVEGYSISPNNPSDVPVNLLLPSTMVYTGNLVGADLTWYSQTFLQNFVGTARQMNAATRYNVTAGDVNNAWNGAYAGQLIDLQSIVTKATADGNPWYAGIARVLTAYNLGVMTDAWGDIPYSEALKGTDNFGPTFDNSETGIYAAIFQNLGQAIIDLSVAEGDNVLLPGSDDLIFGGDAAAWKAAAHALRARYYNHYSQVDVAEAAKALGEIASAMADNSGDMDMPYGTADPNEANPFYQFNSQRGDLVLGETFVDMLKDDPRKPFLCALANTANDTIYGSSVDNPDIDASMLGAFYGSVNSVIPFVTYAEVKFIEAEAKLRVPDAAGARVAMEEAVKANVEKITGAPADQAWIDAVIPATVTLEDIMKQKHIAMFTQFEGWTDWRRTSFPTLTPYPGQTDIPTRFPYAQLERDLNTANVPTGNEYSLFGKLWWDQ